MKRIIPAVILLLLCLAVFNANAQNKKLKLIFIRHAEKPADGDNLSCIGFNRALRLPDILKTKFGLPDQIYVPALHLGKTTPRARMFQTASPFAIKYNLPVNSKFEEEDTKDLAGELENKKGTILIVWEHNYLRPLINALGIKVKGIEWTDDDFDTIWIVTYKNGEPVLTKDKEGIKAVNNCGL
jgi:hypothetical protein